MKVLTAECYVAALGVAIVIVRGDIYRSSVFLFLKKMTLSIGQALPVTSPRCQCKIPKPFFNFTLRVGNQIGV
jgi:hypothetical protein